MNQNSLFHQNHFFRFNEVPGAHLVDVHARTYRTAQVVDLLYFRSERMMFT